ncbi:hypothetical protein G6677_07775 [Polynucleobacter paneuropaeus]|nr:hypothetical protein [Polynucleobacter paneuropaeus]
MKKLQFLIACIFLSSGVFAADWLSAGKADDEEWLVNKSYTQQGSLRNVTWMRNFTYEGQKMSQKIVDSMDCSKKQTTTVSVVLYKGHNFSGPVVPYKAPSIGKVTNIDFNKVDGYPYELFCQSNKPVETAGSFDKTGLIDMKSSATIAGSCYAVSGAARMIAMGIPNFNAMDAYAKNSDIFMSMRDSLSMDGINNFDRAWHGTGVKIGNDQAQCKNCVAAANTCASMLKR